jgi:hypothetical protein
MTKHRWMFALLLAMPGIASAADPAPEDAAFGTQTRAWLELQTSNNASLGAARPMPGEVAEQVYSRYVKSFSHPIPENFERESFGSGSE